MMRAKTAREEKTLGRFYENFWRKNFTSKTLGISSSKECIEMDWKINNKPQPIFVRFLRFTDHEKAQKKAKELKGTDFVI